MRGVDEVAVQEARTVPVSARPKRGLRSILHRPRRRPFRYTLTGLAGAVLFLCLSLTPSLLPRTGVTQGLISGITAAFGYGVGVLAANVWDAFAGREARPASRRSWLIFARGRGGRVRRGDRVRPLLAGADPGPHGRAAATAPCR